MLELLVPGAGGASVRSWIRPDSIGTQVTPSTPESGVGSAGAYATIPLGARVELVWDWGAGGAGSFSIDEQQPDGTFIRIAGRSFFSDPSSGVDDFVTIDGRLLRIAVFMQAGSGGEGGSVSISLHERCPCDADCSGYLSIDDIDTFVAQFLAGDLAADLTGDGAINLDDIDAFVACFLSGCL